MRRLTIVLSCALLAPLAATAQTGIINTFAGGGPNNLPALSANLAVPTGLAVDAAGNYYVTSITQDRVFKVNSAGQLTVFAGTGLPGFSGDGGPATGAMLQNPQGIAVDTAGNVFIADRDNQRIRRVDAATGIITTVAGTGTPGFNADGIAATSAHLRVPSGVALDAAGNLYIADQSNQRVRRVSAGPDGVVTGAADEIITTVAGTGVGGFSGDGGPATAATLRNPTDLSFDASGNLYICDASNHRIRRVGAGGIIATVAGNGIAGFGGDGGAATAASLNVPLGITVAADKLYIADQFNNRARVVDLATGIIATLAGTGVAGFGGDGGPASSAMLQSPRDVLVDGDGSVLISDATNNRIRRVDAVTQTISTVAGIGSALFVGDGFAATSATLSLPNGVAVDAGGNLFIAEGGNSRVRRVDGASGIITTVAGNGIAGFGGNGGPATSASLRPTAVAVDRAGNLYISEFTNARVRRVDAASGIITTVAGGGSSLGDGGPATSASVGRPAGIAVDVGGNLFIGDTVNHRIRRVDAATGIITTVAGGGSSLGDGGPATSASLNNPFGVALDASGNLFIVDRFNQRIRRVDAATGVITTVAGNGVQGFSGDGGPATSASLSDPFGVAVDATGNLLIADRGNSRIRRVDAASGIITTVAGNGVFGFSGDGGPATDATLADPIGVAVGAGNLLIADRGNHRIRRVTLNKPPVADAGPDQLLIVGEGGTFDGSASFDPDGSIQLYVWDFGDGVSSSGAAVVSHAYATAGTFTATLTVTDDQGESDSDTASVTVQTQAEAIQSLSQLVQSFNFQQGISNSLDAKLENVLAALQAANAEQRQDAANKLQAFIQGVEAQRGKEITNAQADQLIALAQRILAVL